MSEIIKSSPHSPEKVSVIVERSLTDKDIKDVINSSFSKFNFHFQQLNEKYKIKMEDLSINSIDKIFLNIINSLDKRIEELDLYVNQYFKEENNNFSSPQKNKELFK